MLAILILFPIIKVYLEFCLFCGTIMENYINFLIGKVIQINIYKALVNFYFITRVMFKNLVNMHIIILFQKIAMLKLVFYKEIL